MATDQASKGQSSWPPPPNSFAGWVPCITGQLSFSLIGTLTDSTTLNLATASEPDGPGPVRYIAVAQQRRSSDLPLPGWIVQGFRAWAACDYILVAKTAPAKMPVWDGDKLRANLDHMGVLEGEVFVIPHHVDGRAANRVNALRQSARNDITSYSSDLSNQISAEDGDTLISRITEDLGNPPDGVRIPRAQFRLYRTGELRIWIPPSQVQGAHEVGVQGDDGEAGLGPALCRQIYYFIKDATHRHYHHDPEADNILPLVQSSPQDDVSWRRETLWALVRAVLEGRRRSELYAYKDALGVLSYADAFQGLLARIRRKPDVHDAFEQQGEVSLYSLGPTRSSIEAKREELTWTKSQRFQLFALLIASGLAVAALWIAAVQIEESICRAALPNNASVTTLSAPSHALTPSIIVPDEMSEATEEEALPSEEERRAVPGSGPSTVPDPNLPTSPQPVAAPECAELVPPSAAHALAYFIRHPFQMLAGGIVLAVWITLFIGRGLRSISAYRRAHQFVRGFALAIGATLSRRVRRFVFASADSIGAGGGAISILIVWLTLLVATWSLLRLLGH